MFVHVYNLVHNVSMCLYVICYTNSNSNSNIFIIVTCAMHIYVSINKCVDKYSMAYT